MKLKIHSATRDVIEYTSCTIDVPDQLAAQIIADHQKTGQFDLAWKVAEQLLEEHEGKLTWEHFGTQEHMVHTLEIVAPETDEVAASVNSLLERAARKRPKKPKPGDPDYVPFD